MPRHRAFGRAVLAGFVLMGLMALHDVGRAATPTPGDMFMVSGRYVGDGTNGHAITGLGFQPDVVLVKGLDGTPTAIKTSTMGGNGAKLLGVASKFGDRLIRSLDADGFTVGSDPEVNTAGVVYDWVALVTASNRMVTGTYSGNGSDNRQINVGFKPDYLIVLADRDVQAVQRFRDQVGDVSFTFADGSPTADWIQSFAGSGFTVGTSDEVNRDRTTYHYIAWRRTGGAIETTSYTGDGTDDRDVTDPNFTPFVTFLAGEGAGRPTVQRIAPVIGDVTYPAGPGAGFPDGIQSVIAKGFQVGADPRVNAAGGTYYWVTLQNAQGYELDIHMTADRTVASPGDTVTFDLALRNHGPNRGDNIQVTDLVPAALTFVSGSPSIGTTYTAVSGLWDVGRLETGGAATLRLRAVVTPAALGTTVENRAAITAMQQPDIFDGNNRDSVRVRVPAADLDLSAGTDDWTPTQDLEFQLVFDLSNHGPDGVSTINVSTRPPAGLSYVSYGASSGAYDPASGSWSVDSLSAGQSARLLLTVRPEPGASGSSITAIASVLGASRPDPNPANDTDSVTVSVISPGSRVATGSYVGDGIPGHAIGGVGFQPDLLIVRGVGSTPTLVRTRTMIGDAARELGSNTPLVTGRITGLGADGFTVGADATVNAVGVTYHWAAFLEAPGQMRVGSYVGNALDNRNITGAGFQPDYVMLWGENGKSPFQRFAAEVGDASLSFDGSNETADRIQGFEPDGFQVGTNNDVNSLGVTYHYATWKSTPGRSGGGVYAGNSLDNRPLDDLGFRPHVMFLVREDGGTATLARTLSVPGDLTFPVPASAGFTNGVQALRPHGFEVGSDAAVNQASKNYLYFAMRSSAGADLAVAASVNRPAPSENDTVTIRLNVTNFGPEPAGGIETTYPVPAGLAYQDASPSQGAYDPATGVWSVGTLADGVTATLDVRVVVDAGTAGSTIVNTATVTASGVADPVSSNDSGSVSFTVQAADLKVVVSVEDATPTETEVAVFTARVTNLGPDPATSVSIMADVPAGLDYQSDTPSQGTFDAASGIWSAGAIAPGDTAILTLRADVTASAGSVVSLPVSVAASAQLDPSTANDADSVRVVVQRPLLRVVTGTYVGNGAPSRTVGGLGFQPDLVIVKGAGATRAVVRSKTMKGDVAKELGTNTALVADRIRSLDPDGFTVGGNAEVNAIGVTYLWTAFLEAPNQMRVGTYTGNGLDNRNLTGIGFQPGYVMLWSAAGDPALQRYAAEIGDACLPFQANAEVSDRIQAFAPDGFQVGSNGDVNGLGNTYHYVAWNTVPALTGGGSYAGNSLDNRAIEPLGFRPHFLLVARKEGGSPTMMRALASTGDLTYPAVDDPALANAVQRLLPGGFEVGSDPSVNLVSKNYFHFGFRDAIGADLDVGVTVDSSVPSERDTITLTVTAINRGPEAATGIRVSNSVPSMLSLVQALPSQGTYDAGTGLWTVGAISADSTAHLDLRAVVNIGTAGSTVVDVARVTASDLVDPVAWNDADTLAFVVQLADLEVTNVVDDATPTEGESVLFTAKVANLGPHPATGVSVLAPVPAGLSYVSSVAGQGAYTPGSGLWSIGGIAVGDTVTLTLRAAAASPAGSVVPFAVRVDTLDQVDPISANDVSTATVHVLRPEMRVATGSYVGDGSASRSIAGLGFQPDLLIVRGTGLTYTVVRTKTMFGDAAKQLGVNAAFVTGRVRSLDPDGFTVGNATSVNAAGVTYYWTAFLEAPGQMQVGSYVGDGLDNRSISGLGFQPGYMMLWSAAAEPAFQRFAGEVGDASLAFQAQNEQSDRIQAFEPDGFQIGGNNDINTPGVTHHYVAWNGAYVRVGTGLYLGNGTDNRPITAVGFRPKMVFLKRLDNSPAVWRPSSVPGDLTLPGDATQPFGDGIQGMLSNGFEVGTNASVNAADKVVLWTAFRDVPSVDLAVTVTVSDSLPNEGDDVVYTIRLRNLGPEQATGVAVTDALPEGVTYQTHIPSRGVYTPATGVWTIGSVANGDSATLQIVAAVGPGTAGKVFTHSASVSALDQTDSNGANDQAEATIRVQMGDLAVRTTADQLSPLEGDGVQFRIDVTNRGPDGATGVAITDLLPSGLTLQIATPERGSYDPGTGIWSVGSLAVNDTARLTLASVVDAGTAGSSLLNIARVTASDQADPLAANGADTTEIFVSYGPGILISADQVATAVRPGASAATLMRLTIRNSTTESRVLKRLTFTNRTTGPGTTAQRDQELGTVTLYVDDGDGSFDPVLDAVVRRGTAAAGLIVLDSLDVPIGEGSLNQLHLVAEVPLAVRDGDSLDVSIQSASDVGFDLSVTPLNSWPVDPPERRPVDGMSAAQAIVRPVGDHVIQGASRVPALDVVLPANGYEPDVLEELHLDNLGDAEPGTDISLVELWGDGGNGVFDAGTGDDFVIGVPAWADSSWSLTGLSIPMPLGGRRIYATVNVPKTARPGRTIDLALAPGAVPGVVVSSGNDGPVDDPVSGAGPMVILPGPSSISVHALPQAPQVLTPGRGGVEVFALEIANQAASPETLTTLSLSNATAGPGTVVQRDAEWLPLNLVVDETSIATGSFSAGRATFSGLDVVIAPGDTSILHVSGGASLAARDGDLLDLRVNDGSELTFSRTVELSGAWPADPAGSFPVDGMVAAQVTVGESTSSELLTGSTRTLGLDLTLPPNGYQPDTLKFLLVENQGSANPISDVTQVEAWTDDGDGVFEPSGTTPDTRLGVMQYSGAAWVLAGFSVPVPATGLRVFISCDVADDAVEGGTVRFAVPSNPIAGIGMASANDGPLDVAVRNSQAMTITTVDRIALTASNLAGGVVAPGDTQVVLLHLKARNTYRDSARTLTRVTVTNRTTDPRGADQADLDGQVSRLSLRDGSATGPVLATSLFAGGEATFSGFARPIAPGETRSLFVTATVSAVATDEDVIAAAVANESALEFAEQASLSATFPLESGASWSVNGMTARQIMNYGAPSAVLGPGEGPVLALDLGVPRNGYRDDTFEQLRLMNAGTAGPTDLASVRLWKDGGDGVFNAGAGDDEYLGPMTFISGGWLGPVVAEPIGVGGLRLFVSVSSSGTPTDSASVLFQVPLNGITVSSRNDGPNDVPVVNNDPLLLSTSGILASFVLDDDAGVVGDSVTVRMVVRNTGSLPITNVTPEALQVVPDSILAMLTGPQPASLDLVVGGQVEFRWTLRADLAGAARFRGSAAGIELGTSRTVRSIEVTSGEYHAFNQASNLSLFPVQSMPFSVQPGQQQVVPMSLTLTNPGGTEASDILLRSVTLRLEDEAGSGVVPSDLLDRIVMNEGTNVYVDVTSVPNSGSTITLTPASPIRIRSGDALGQQITLSLSLDVSASTTVRNFRLALREAGWVAANDANNGAPVSVTLESGLAYPVLSGLARVVSDADRIDVTAGSLALRNAGGGQTSVPMLLFTLTNPGPSGVGSDIRVSRFALQLTDGSGSILPAPVEWLDRIRVSTAAGVLVERSVTGSDDSTVVVTLPAALSIPVGSPFSLTVSGDIRSDAAPGVVHMRLAPSPTLSARLVSTGDAVPAAYASDPIEGPAVRIQALADSILASSAPAMPASLFLGAQGVHAFDVVLEHPGPMDAADARCDTLGLRLRDQLNQPLVPSVYLDRVVAIRDGAVVGTVTDLPPSGGDVLVPLTGVQLAPGGIASLEIRFDMRATAPTGFIQMQVGADGVVARDVNVGTQAVPLPAAGFEFPLTSGLGRIQTPPRELTAGFEGSMPAIMPGSGPALPIARITLRNPAEAGAIEMDSLEVMAADRAFQVMPFDGAVGTLQAFVADTLWAEEASIPAGATRGILAGAPLIVDAGKTVEIELRATARPDATVSSFRLGVARDGIGIVQPSSSLLAVTLTAEEGQSFPFWTDATSVGGATLQSSYSNFPNPFAAGRDATTFVYYLRTDARVTLKIWTARGEVVATLLDNAPRAAGLYQYDRWDGRNGRGNTVTNGAYLAELIARFSDGTTSRVLRKVAVTR